MNGAKLDETLRNFGVVVKYITIIIIIIII
jgi:hypothetical protein